MCEPTATTAPITDLAEERDINDIFDDIVLTEERINDKAYEEGFLDGAKSGNTEGYHLGYHRGAELGAELGFYQGLLSEHLRSDSVTERQKSAIEKVVNAIAEFPRTNDENVDILALADNIRAQCRKVCATLKINGKFPETDQLSF